MLVSPTLAAIAVFRRALDQAAAASLVAAAVAVGAFPAVAVAERAAEAVAALAADTDNPNQSEARRRPGG